MRAGLQELMFAALVAAECQRAPPEDFTSRPTTPTAPQTVAAPPTVMAPTAVAAPSNTFADPASRGPKNRCIAATPAQAPPSVASAPPSACPPDPERATPARTFVSVAFPEALPETKVQAELVRSPHDTARGLMYRTKMADSRGMLFDLTTREDHQFWMHNTCIPLDLLYLDDDGLIVGIVENAPTLNDEPRGVGCPSRYVLEVNAGWARRHGVKAGQSVPLPAELTSK